MARSANGTNTEMSAAAFVLAINLFVAAIFATAFGVVSAYQGGARGPMWLALGYGTGILTALLEFILPYQQDHRLVSVGIFLSFLCAVCACIIGLAYHYRLRRPWTAMAVLIVLALIVNILSLDLPRGDLVRGLMYQGSYTLAQALGALILLGNKRWRALDLALLAIFVLSALHFLAKPILAEFLGSGAAPQDYLGSRYAAYSQSLGAVLLISNGLVMLLIIVRDMIADMTARSETDTLSNLLNRRGFEEHARYALANAARAGMPAAMIVADLDHFKSVNDSFGHAAGDAVIAAFADILRNIAEQRSIIGRLGGEEFAILVPGANLMTGRLYAETARMALASRPPPSTGPGPSPGHAMTASFGIAALRPGDSLSDLLRRADVALYQAKSEGRNRVSLFMDETTPMPSQNRLLRF